MSGVLAAALSAHLQQYVKCGMRMRREGLMAGVVVTGCSFPCTTAGVTKVWYEDEVRRAGGRCQGCWYGAGVLGRVLLCVKPAH